MKLDSHGQRSTREAKMPQTGFTRVEDACARPDGGECDKISSFEQVSRERFRARLDEAWCAPDSERKAPSDRPPCGTQ